MTVETTVETPVEPPVLCEAIDISYDSSAHFERIRQEVNEGRYRADTRPIEYFNSESEYLRVLSEVLAHGRLKEDRTGTGTLSLHGLSARYTVEGTYSFPLLTTKKMAFKAILGELIWFLNGDTNIKFLKDNGIKIWDEWADENGELGPVYGKQWRNFGGNVDQIKVLIEGLRANPLSRRHIVSAWNPQEVDDMALPPCHSFFQLLVRPAYEEAFYSREDSCEDGNSLRGSVTKKSYCVSLSLYQRSADMFLGVPFNIASYALLLKLICAYASTPEVEFVAEEFIHTMGDCHIYANHIDQVKEQLSRPRFELPRLLIDEARVRQTDFLKGLDFDMFILAGYHSGAAIKAPVAV